MGSYIRPLLFGWQYFILYEKHCFCIPELRWWESRLLFEQSIVVQLSRHKFNLFIMNRYM